MIWFTNFDFLVTSHEEPILFEENANSQIFLQRPSLMIAEFLTENDIDIEHLDGPDLEQLVHLIGNTFGIY